MAGLLAVVPVVLNTARDNFIGDAYGVEHDFLRGMDEKNARPQISGKARWVDAGYG
jgi:hypothetical protein